MLANWRRDQYQYDPNLRCDVNYYNQDFTKYPYNDDDIATLCKNDVSPSLPLPNNLRGVQRLNNGAVRLMNVLVVDKPIVANRQFNVLLPWCYEPMQRSI